MSTLADAARFNDLQSYVEKRQLHQCSILKEYRCLMVCVLNILNILAILTILTMLSYIYTALCLLWLWPDFSLTPSCQSMAWWRPGGALVAGENRSAARSSGVLCGDGGQY